MSTALQRAIEALAIADVFPHSLKVTVVDPFQPKYTKEPIGVQWRFSSTSIRTYTLNEVNDPSESHEMIAFLVETAVRYTRPETEEADESVDLRVVASIETTFCAEYRRLKEVDEEALETFAENNVMYHVWPYWRELVQTEAARFRLPAFTLPVFRVKKAEAIAAEPPAAPK